jgi:hypothetical protein
LTGREPAARGPVAASFDKPTSALCVGARS